MIKGQPRSPVHPALRAGSFLATKKEDSLSESSLLYVVFLKARIICITACFCSAVRLNHESKSSLVSGVISIMLFSEKNCERVIPKPLHIASRVEIEGSVFLRKILAIVDSESPHSLDKRYSDQPHSSGS